MCSEKKGMLNQFNCICQIKTLFELRLQNELLQNSEVLEQKPGLRKQNKIKIQSLLEPVLCTLCGIKSSHHINHFPEGTLILCSSQIHDETECMHMRYVPAAVVER